MDMYILEIKRISLSRGEASKPQQSYGEENVNVSER
jgi:hypothetical protein